jgi:hypothetical protein
MKKNKPYGLSSPTTTINTAPSSKERRRRALVSVVLAATCLVAAAQDAWQPSDDFQLVSGLRSYGAGICFSSAGDLFAVGTGTTQSGGAAVINVSTDIGSTWTTLPPITPPGATSACFTAVASDSSAPPPGRLYAGGRAQTSTPLSLWIVYRSNDGGATWGPDPDDVFSGLAPGKGASCNDVVVDSAGNVYACGFAVDAKGVQCWTVRKRGANGWATLEAIGTKTYMSFARAVAIHPTDGVFVAGYIGASGGPIWTVRRCSNAGGPFTTVDSYPAKYGSSATDMVVDSAGTVYVSGWTETAIKGLNVYNWEVRRRVAGGTWVSLPGPIYSSNYGSPMSMTVDASGRLFLAGSTGTPTIATHWLNMRGEWVNGGWQWQPSDDFSGGASVLALTSDASGNVLATGYGPGATPGDGYHWITRKLPPTH